MTPLDLLPPGQKRNDDYFDNVTASTKLGYDVTGNFDLGLVGRYSNSLAQDHRRRLRSRHLRLLSVAAPDPYRYAAIMRRRGTAHLVLGGRVDQTLGLGYSSTVTSDMDPNNGAIPSSGNRIKLDWQGKSPIADGETVVLGAETARDAMHVPISRRASPPMPALANCNPACRACWVAAWIFTTASASAMTTIAVSATKTTWHVAPALAIDGTGTRLHASYGTGFKAPSLEQLFESFPAFFFFANPNLKPETSAGYDLGLRSKLLFGVTGGVTWFHNDIKNLIETDPVTFSTDVNIGRARTEGLESLSRLAAAGDAEAARRLYLYRGRRRWPCIRNWCGGPRHKASLDARWQAMEALSLDASLLYVGQLDRRQPGFFGSRLNAHPYVTADIAASLRADR